MDYSRLAATSSAQIADKGRSVSLVFETQGTYAPATDTFTGQTSSSQTVKMVITNYRKNEMDETMIKIGDRQGLLAPDNLLRAPKTGDTVTDGAETFAIVSIEEIKPGDTTLLYKLQLRRGGGVNGLSL